jgi:hypothetical protein
MAMNAPRVRIASIAENRPPWCDEIRVLFASLRILGGSLATAPAIAYFVSSVSRETAAFLADLDVDVRVVEPMHPEVPKTNVLRLYEEPETYDWLVSLDPDVVVVRDFAEHLTGAELCGRQADGSPLTLEEWRSMFAHFGLQLPTRRHVTIRTGETTIPYPNSGVLFVPSGYVESLRDTWLEFAAAIARDRSHLPATLLEKQRWSRNQLSLALALHGFHSVSCRWR